MKTSAFCFRSTRFAALSLSLALIAGNVLRSMPVSATAPDGAAAAPVEPGFTSLFDGHSLDGWTLVGKRGAGYGVTNGVIYCAREGGGNLFTERESSDFVLRIQFKLEPGGNNGVGIRAPLEGDAAYNGTEIQPLDDKAPKHATIKPWQCNGSVYNVVPAKNGTAKIGEWNDYEITAKGRKSRVGRNGRTIVD